MYTQRQNTSSSLSAKGSPGSDASKAVPGYIVLDASTVSALFRDKSETDLEMVALDERKIIEEIYTVLMSDNPKEEVENYLDLKEHIGTSMLLERELQEMMELYRTVVAHINQLIELHKLRSLQLKKYVLKRHGSRLCLIRRDQYVEQLRKEVGDGLV